MNQSAMSSETAVRTDVTAKMKLRAYFQLTKPTIMLLVLVTGIAAMVVEGSLLNQPFTFWLVSLGIVLAGGSASAFNQYLDRDIDSVMERTRKKRPLPQGILSPTEALTFASLMGVVSTFVLYAFGGFLAAALGVATIFYYVVIYTIWLKRTTPYNIVIGGAAGAAAPLIGWAAATGTLSFTAFAMFMIIFMWTPPHFWALSLCVKDEYAKASVPMLPVVAGVEETKKQILLYTLTLLPITLVLVVCGALGVIYFTGATVLGVIFIRSSLKVARAKPEELQKQSRRTFAYSIVYLFALFLLMVADVLMMPRAHAAEPLPKQLEGVGIQEKLGSQVDRNLTFKDEEGKVVPLSSVVDGKKPTMLLLAYYGCPNLCNYFLNGVTDGLKQFQYQAGREFNILTVSIDPREDSDLAKAKKASHIAALGKPEAASGWHFWVNDQEMKDADAQNAHDKTLAEEVGFHYHYDKESAQFAHTSAIVMLTPEGKVSRYLYGIQFKPNDLRLAVLEAGGHKIGTVMDRIILFCYHYDSSLRGYSLYASNVMRAGGGIMVLILVGFLGTAYRRRSDRRIS